MIQIKDIEGNVAIETNDQKYRIKLYDGDYTIEVETTDDSGFFSKSKKIWKRASTMGNPYGMFGTAQPKFDSLAAAETKVQSWMKGSIYKYL